MKSAEERAVEARVAAELARLRQEAGLTLGELARRSGLSAAYLSRAENGRVAVPVATLARLARIYAIPLAGFFEEEATAKRLVRTAAGGGRLVRFRGRQGPLARLLADEKAEKLMEPLVVEVPPARRMPEVRGHEGEEFNYVLRGRCRLIHGEVFHDLEPGDAVYFDASVPHVLHARGGGRCKVLVVVASRDQRSHRHVGKVVVELAEA